MAYLQASLQWNLSLFASGSSWSSRSLNEQSSSFFQFLSSSTWRSIGRRLKVVHSQLSEATFSYVDANFARCAITRTNGPGHPFKLKNVQPSSGLHSKSVSRYVRGNIGSCRDNKATVTSHLRCVSLVCCQMRAS
jgi:hypothetical protein